MLRRENVDNGLVRVAIPVLEIERAAPLPTWTESVPGYGVWIERLSRSEVIWCVAPVSEYHD